jgi:hypothetical protein
LTNRCLPISIYEYTSLASLALAIGPLRQAYAWNAFREDKTITSVKYNTKKGFYAVAA